MLQFFDGTEKKGRFFLVVPPGFEDAAHRELVERARELEEPIRVLEVVRGGIEVEANILEGVSLNHLLKVPSKILLRIKEQRCRDFTKLYKIIKAISWNKIVGSNQLTWKVSTRASRLKIEKKIIDTCEEAFADYRRAFTTKKADTIEEIGVFVRIEEDNLVLSLDLSGELLHKRGGKQLSSRAPLRENLAAAILWEALSFMKNDIMLIDGMAGAGTFALEALEWNQPLHRRAFSYQYCPWAETIEFTDKNFNSPWKTVLCVEQDQSQFTVLESHLRSHLDRFQQIEMIRSDFFEKKWWGGLHEPAILVLNPPYGDRITIRGPSIQFFKKILQYVFSMPVARAAIIFPKEFKAFANERWAVEKTIDFKNGGIPVRLWIFSKKTL